MKSLSPAESIEAMYRQVPGVDAVVGIAASGVFADQPAKGVTGGGVVSGALHSFVLAAALELEGRYRVDVVSPTIVGDSVDEYADLFPGLNSVPTDTLVAHYIDCIEGAATGQIIRAYG